MQNDTFEALQPLYYAILNASQTFVRDFGNFLPHGATITKDGEVELVGVGPDHGGDMTNSVEILPNLHEALRLYTAKAGTLAIAVSESVSINPDGKLRPAIKVLIEHRNGEVEAIYQTYTKKLWGKVVFDDVMFVDHAAEVGGWR